MKTLQHLPHHEERPEKHIKVGSEGGGLVPPVLAHDVFKHAVERQHCLLPHVNESCASYEGFMHHVWMPPLPSATHAPVVCLVYMSHVPNMNEWYASLNMPGNASTASCHTGMGCVPHMNESCASVPLMNESCASYKWFSTTYECHHCLLPHMHESCASYEWVMCHVWMSHVPCMNESCATYEWVMCLVWTRVI